MHIVGSYRRNKRDSGDADILISPVPSHTHAGPELILPSILAELKSIGFLLADLSTGEAKGDCARTGRESYMGVCRLRLEDVPEKVRSEVTFGPRRLDIKVWPREMLPFGLMYFTGSDHFNRSMRYYAQRYKTSEAPQGYTLNDQGLFACTRTKKGKIKGKSFPCATEEEIFAELNLQYKAPTERNCFDVDVLHGEAEDVPEPDDEIFDDGYESS